MALPIMDLKNSPTGCCPIFEPNAWDKQTFDLTGQKFAKATTKSFLYMPLNMGKVMTATQDAIEKAEAKDPDRYLILSEDVSKWRCDHYFEVSKDVPGLEMVTLDGTYYTEVFDGPYKNISQFIKTFESHIQANGHEMKRFFAFYTTCPSCAKVYGHNYMVLFGQI